MSLPMSLEAKALKLIVGKPLFSESTIRTQKNKQELINLKRERSKLLRNDDDGDDDENDENVNLVSYKSDVNNITTTMKSKMARRLVAEEASAQQSIQRSVRAGVAGDVVDAKEVLKAKEAIPDLAAAISDRAKKNSQILRFSKQLSGFRLGGISCFSVGGPNGDKLLGLRFEESWAGVFGQARFYVILSNVLLIHRHTLPYWIPVQELQNTFLPHDPIALVQRISRYIATYACRGVLAKNLEDEYQGRATVNVTVARDMITLNALSGLKTKGKKLVQAICFKYEHLLDTLPSELSVQYVANMPGAEAEIQVFNPGMGKTEVFPDFLVREVEYLFDVGDEEEEDNNIVDDDEEALDQEGDNSNDDNDASSE